ncbi:MAG: polysaccharide deacetylase family protein [Spirochaetota bacterium]|nr:polysaccharide deacetylase family protein [Spirochaetota bacterium]
MGTLGIIQIFLTINFTGGTLSKNLNFIKPKLNVAITFDACETRSPSFFDEKLLNYLIDNKIPFTLFISGKFLLRNKKEVKKISKYSFVEIENHSYSHKILTKKTKDFIIKDVKKNTELIEEITGIKPKFFRFPAGIYNKNTLKTIESLGLKVVHWSFESGDPDKSITDEHMLKTVSTKIKNNSILIFHINRRGWNTAKAIPKIVLWLKNNNYKLHLLKDLPKITYIK